MATPTDHLDESENQLRGAYNTEDDLTHEQCVARAQTHALLAIARSLEVLAGRSGETST